MEDIKKYLKGYGLELKLHTRLIDITAYRKRMSRRAPGKGGSFLVSNFEDTVGFIFIEDWKRYFKPKKKITEETEKEITYLFNCYRLTMIRGRLKIKDVSKYKISCFSRDNIDGINALIDGWELRSMFMDDEEVLSVLKETLYQRISGITDNDMFRKIEKELPQVIMGKEI